MTVEEVIASVSDIPSYVLEDDIRLYYKYMEMLHKEDLVLDVGTGLGKSAIALALSNPFAIVITIDNAQYPILRGWTKSEDDYYEEMEKRFEDHHIMNATFLIDDVLTDQFDLDRINLFHLDCEKDIEEKVLFKMLPRIAPGGFVLIRNFDRFEEQARKMIDEAEFHYEERLGKIQVIRRAT